MSRTARRVLYVIAGLFGLAILAIAALWLWICLNPGIIYCYKGGIYMSQVPGPLPAL